jgi:hypothetical protein
MSRPVARAFTIDSGLRQIEEIEADARELTAPLDDERINAGSGISDWSIAQCLGHLTLFTQVFLPGWDAAIAEGKRLGLRRSSEAPHGFVLECFLRLMEPPYTLKAKTGKAFVPTGRRTKPDVLEEFFAAHRQAEQRMRAAEGLDFERVRVDSPLLKHVRYPLGFAFDLYTAHERRHLWQARRIRAALLGR